MLSRVLSILLLVGLPLSLVAQPFAPILVADRTFKMDGDHVFNYAFAKDDEVSLRIEVLVGRQVRQVEFAQLKGPILFSTYALDTALVHRLRIPQTGIYQLLVRERGLGKKVCRIVLHRTPASPLTEHFDTRITWDVSKEPNFREQKRSISVGKRTEIVSLGGQVNVSANKMWTKKPMGLYQFTLPPNTVRWAFRITVGQATAEARRKDAEALKGLLQSGAVKMLAVAPETALAAFALGAAVDLGVPKVSEVVDYALLSRENADKFFKGEKYQAFIFQENISADVQRRSSPLTGTWYFAFRNDNWLNDIAVQIDIEAVVETPIYAEEIYLAPIR
ncbi:MAG: hypothetical protein NZM43_11585 [Saprospiraceae bacterium]|nr:hypothetical protein [Saprospiraceae bacterium]MDW8484950.1 hypothetical protein [Saprospiraceae bacterium]